MTSTARLEAVAEEGNNSLLDDALDLNSGFVSPFAPRAYSVGANSIFNIGEIAPTAIEGLAEDDNVSGYTDVFNTPDTATSSDSIFPTGSYSFNFTATAGNKLSFGTMLIQSNDWFICINQ